MTSEAVIVAVIDALHAVDVPFMIVGSVATNFYGIPRSTRDADFVIQAPRSFAALATPFYALQPGRLVIAGHRVRVHEDYLENCIEAIDSLVEKIQP